MQQTSGPAVGEFPAAIGTSPEHPALHGLQYAQADAPARAGWWRFVGAFSILTGCGSMMLNAFVALGMFGQAYKNYAGLPGKGSRDKDAWLIATGTEAVIAAVLAMFLIGAGTVTLFCPAPGARLHRWFAWAKLPLACVVAVCAGWFTRDEVARELQVVAAGAILAMIAAAAYPLFLLRTFRKPRDRIDLL